MVGHQNKEASVNTRTYSKKSKFGYLTNTYYETIKKTFLLLKKWVKIFYNSKLEKLEQETTVLQTY